jgi:hypothetical protein
MKFWPQNLLAEVYARERGFDLDTRFGDGTSGEAILDLWLRVVDRFDNTDD